MDKNVNRAAEKAKEKRKNVLEAARKRFLHYGYKKTTLDEIALDAGISKASIYMYFKNKENILIELIDFEAYNMQKTMFSTIKKESDPSKKLQLLIRKAIEYIDGNPFLKRLLRRDPEIITPRLIKHVFEIEDLYTDIIEGYVKDAMAGKESFNPRVIAYTYYKIFEAFSYASTINEKDGVSTEEINQFLQHLIERSLSSP